MLIIFLYGQQRQDLKSSVKKVILVTQQTFNLHCTSTAADVPFTYVFLGLWSGICIYVCILFSIWLAYSSTKFLVYSRPNYILKHILNKLNPQCETYKNNFSNSFQSWVMGQQPIFILSPLKNVRENNLKMLDFL